MGRIYQIDSEKCRVRVILVATLLDVIGTKLSIKEQTWDVKRNSVEKNSN